MFYFRAVVLHSHLQNFTYRLTGILCVVSMEFTAKLHAVFSARLLFVYFRYITMAFPVGNLAALRTFRVLRALKTVAVVPGKKLMTVLCGRLTIQF